jgi:molecular chaperone GrpE (heat shock protein)
VEAKKADLANLKKQALEIREEYLKYANAKRRGEDVSLIDFNLSIEELKDLAEKEQFILDYLQEIDEKVIDVFDAAGIKKPDISI